MGTAVLITAVVSVTTIESHSDVEVESNGKEFNYHLSSDLYGTTK